MDIYNNDVLEELFWKIYHAANEAELHDVVKNDSFYR